MPFGKGVCSNTCHSHPQGRFFGIVVVTSTSRNIPPSTNPSRTQLSAFHQSS
jgi:hypothetical protein